MNSKRGGGKQSLAGAVSSSPKDKSVSPHYGLPSGGSDSRNNTPKVDQLSHDVADISLDNAQDGEWEVCARKLKNRAGTGAAKAKPWGPQSPDPKAWGQPNTAHKLRLTSNGGTGRSPGDVWQRQVTDPWRPAGRGSPKANSSNMGSHHHPVDDDDDEPLDDDDDDDILSDDYNSDESQKRHETFKKSKRFKVFFDALDNLTIQQINESTRRWHCPACKDGPGGIDWYRGLQPLVTHAKTKGTRVKLHRQFAELLDEKLRWRGPSFIPAGEAYGRWKGLQQTVTDKEIVWPPIIVIMNTRLDQNENDEWIGMGDQELLDYFSSYAAVKAQHSSGPRGHRGMSILIFESSATGYVEAERLDDHFRKEGTHREAWKCHHMHFSAGGKRQLYGFMACKEDLDIFNQHSHGKSVLKFEIKSYQEMVVGPMKQMSEDNQQLTYFKKEVEKKQRHSKVLEKSFGVLNEKLRKTMEDNHIVRQRMKVQHEQNKGEMDYQEKFFKDQISCIQQSLEEKERNFEKQFQEKRQKMKQSNMNSMSKEAQNLRGEEMGKFIQAKQKEVEEFEAEREKLIRLHEIKKAEIKKRHFEEEIGLEKEFETAMTVLLSKYTPSHSKEGNASNSQA